MSQRVTPLRRCPGSNLADVAGQRCTPGRLWRVGGRLPCGVRSPAGRPRGKSAAYSWRCRRGKAGHPHRGVVLAQRRTVLAQRGVLMHHQQHLAVPPANCARASVSRARSAASNGTSDKPDRQGGRRGPRRQGSTEDRPLSALQPDDQADTLIIRQEPAEPLPLNYCLIQECL